MRNGWIRISLAAVVLLLPAGGAFAQAGKPLDALAGAQWTDADGSAIGYREHPRLTW